MSLGMTISSIKPTNDALFKVILAMQSTTELSTLKDDIYKDDGVY